MGTDTGGEQQRLGLRLEVRVESLDGHPQQADRVAEALARSRVLADSIIEHDGVASVITGVGWGEDVTAAVRDVHRHGMELVEKLLGVAALGTATIDVALVFFE